MGALAMKIGLVQLVMWGGCMQDDMWSVAREQHRVDIMLWEYVEEVPAKEEIDHVVVKAM